MAFQLRRDESVPKGLARVVRKELRSAIEQLQVTQPSDEGIHEARKSIKKVRAVLQLVRKDVDVGPAVDQLRTVAHVLSPIRDAEAMTSTVRSLCERHRSVLSATTCRAVTATLEDKKTRARRAALRVRAISKAVALLQRVHRAAKDWTWQHTGFSKLLSQVRRAYKRARVRMLKVSPRSRADTVHEWRKRTKTLWYALRLFEQRGAVRRELTNLEHLETWLGDDHDLASLQAMLRKSDRPNGSSRESALDDVAQQERRMLRKKALTLGRRTFLQPPGRFQRRLERVVR